MFVAHPFTPQVFWHSSAHILGQALERKYKAKYVNILFFSSFNTMVNLCLLACASVPQLTMVVSTTIWPANSKYYLSDTTNDVTLMFIRPVAPEDYEDIQGIVSSIISEKQPFERLSIPKEKAMEMFKFNKYKLEIIKNKVPDGANCTAYRCGPLIDLCKGPHLPNTGVAKAFAVTKNSSAYWLGNAKNDALQRVYGISFPDKKQLAEWEEFQREAAKRDHRNIGKAQDLFFVHPYSPGSSFFLPHGTKVYNKLVQFLRGEYRKRGFSEVITPNMFNSELWQASGHWAKYKDNMFNLKVDEQDFALKPMNCPGHCLMFDHTSRSYRDLPIRFADFGVLHRNEAHGALTGLTRVRRFQQDDAHIFCTQDQVWNGYILLRIF